MKNTEGFESEALALASKISATDLFDVITRALTSPMNNSWKEITEASLAGCLTEHYDATKMTVRAYVEQAFVELSIIQDRVESVISDPCCDDEDRDDEYKRNKNLWLHAYCHAANQVDKKELTLLFVEFWLEENERNF